MRDGENGTPGDAAVTLRGIQVHRGPQRRRILDIERLHIGRGERVAFIGPSGAGKTTLLRLVNGHVVPDVGSVEVLGATLGSGGGLRRGSGDREHRLKIGFVFQNFNLVERATVFDNVLWGRLGRVSSIGSVLGRFPDADKRIAMRAIEEVDLLGQVNQRADTLSGGQKQRVGVARVLAQEAEVIVADEPVSNLDPSLVDDVMSLLVGVCEQHGATLLMSLHQPQLAVRYAHRVVGMRSGRVAWDGPVNELQGAPIRLIYGRDLSPELDTTPPAALGSGASPHS